MRSRRLWSTGLVCLALSVSACEELNVDDDKEHDTGDDSGGDSSGGSSSGGSSSGGSSSGDADNEHGDDQDQDGDPHAKPPRVNIERCGAVVGAWGDHGVRKFLGIPYAKEPSGDLRWAAPQRPDSWDGDREATKFARACPGLGAAPSKDDKHPEDCLYLNVWTPEKPKKPLPIMVWFHGGDHLSGSAAEAHGGDSGARFDGSALAQKSVVVVTINYRLGPLGFMPLGDKQARSGPLFGNQGLWDQAFALQWVQENAEAFGGDPDNVTIFGQGSGAVDVCLHVASPQSGGKDLFHGAIGQSGGCTRYLHTAEEQRDALADFLDKLGCKTDDAEARLGCLRDKSASELFDAIPDRKTGKKWFGPSVDGRFLPDQPRALYEDQRASGVPYLLGSNANDASAVLDDVEPVDSEDAYHKALEKLFPDATEEERCAAYPHDAYAHMKKPYQMALAHVLADGEYACSVLHTAVRARSSGSAVYSHHFTGLDKDGDASADFGSDVGYVFGTSDVPESGSGLRDAVQSYWTSFAGEGAPGKHGDAPDWPQLGTKPRKVYRLGSESEVLLDFRKLQCALWDGAYDAEIKVPAARKPATPEDP